MSNERTGAILHIGGTIPRRLVVALCAEISAATVGLDWSEHGFTPGGAQKTLANCSRDLMASLDDEQHLTVYDDEARQGVMWALEDWLKSHDIPFTRFAEATIECGPMRTDFRPGRPVYETFTDTGRDTLIEASALNKVIAKLQERNRTPTRRIGFAIRTLRRLIGTHLPPLSPFEIGPTLTRHRVR